MTQRLCLVAVLAGAIAALPAVAPAQGLPPAGMTVKEAVDWLAKKGLKGKIQPQAKESDDQVINTVADGINFDIYFYDCEAGRCASMQYVAGWSSNRITADRVNAWNSTHRYIRAYVKSDGGVFGEFDENLSPGGTYAALDDSLETWRSSIRAFKAFMGF